MVWKSIALKVNNLHVNWLQANRKYRCWRFVSLRIWVRCHVRVRLCSLGVSDFTFFCVQNMTIAATASSLLFHWAPFEWLLAKRHFTQRILCEATKWFAQKARNSLTPAVRSQQTIMFVMAYEWTWVNMTALCGSVFNRAALIGVRNRMSTLAYQYGYWNGINSDNIRADALLFQSNAFYLLKYLHFGSSQRAIIWYLRYPADVHTHAPTHK